MKLPARWTAALMLLGTLGCAEDAASPDSPELDPCRLGQTTLAPTDVPTCLFDKRVLSAHDRDEALALLQSITAKRDVYDGDTAASSFWRSAEFTRAMQRIVDFYAQGLFQDSARFHRMLDHVRVTDEYLHGTLVWSGSSARPATTPFLHWVYYNNLGIYFQPVTTVQSVASLFPRPSVPTDSLLGMGEALYRYAIWREHDGLRFPVWEYNFTWNSGGVTVLAPWISSQAQGYGIILFTELFVRTGDPVWRTRAYEVLNSYKVLWDDGGVMLPDTTHGYWWEEFHPSVFIWNGAAQAALAVGELWLATGDPDVKFLFDKGIEAMKYYTPEFDTGYWTLYSRMQWYNTVAYHQSHIRIMDALYTVSQDPYFLEVADRWRTYVPPPGIQ
jgi:hypothetical protein